MNEKNKSCNNCINFIGYGLHWICGKCEPRNEEINLLDYVKKAENCNCYKSRNYEN